MVLADPGPLLPHTTPLFLPPQRPLTGPTPPKLDLRMKRRTPPQTTITQTPSVVQSRRVPVFINTCHDARFASHVGPNDDDDLSLFFQKQNLRSSASLAPTCERIKHHDSYL